VSSDVFGTEHPSILICAVRRHYIASKFDVRLPIGPAPYAKERNSHARICFWHIIFFPNFKALILPDRNVSTFEIEICLLFSYYYYYYYGPIIIIIIIIIVSLQLYIGFSLLHQIMPGFSICKGIDPISQF